MLITNGNLELVDDGIEFVIRVDKASLDGWDPISSMYYFR